jgi:hypothetical protein
MLAWVCWDEFVNLQSPYGVRWMEKCNEAHIAALRIIVRDTLSQAVASREHNLRPGSPEIGHLMSALLMAAMSKLAARKTTMPAVSDEAEDTVTRLMRGLFGNLLTMAGSGVRPLSMVWQLFGLNPQYDIPSTDAEWIWYETVVTLYPYTGWPLEQFHKNLEKLLDKAIVRVVTKSENPTDIKIGRTAEMIRYCKLRNIQLDHSRTIITIFMRMLTTEHTDFTAVAARLLKQLPPTLERQTQSYTRMIKYLQHLAKGGQRRANDDLVAASVYNKRSAAFAELKKQVSEACKSSDWHAMKESCRALIRKQAEIATMWHVKPESLNIQNIKLYKHLLDADLGDDVDQNTKNKNHELTRQVLGDAETWRLPWQVGREGQFGDNIEPLDEALVHEILTGETPESFATINSDDNSDDRSATVTTIAAEQEAENEFAQFQSSLQPKFISTMQKDLSAEDVCGVLKVPVTAMRAFITALNPEFVWEDLGQNFKVVILGLLKYRSNRSESRPIKKLLALASEKKKLQIEG